MNNTSGYCRRTISPIGSYALTGAIISTDNSLHPTIIYLCQLYLSDPLSWISLDLSSERRSLEKFLRRKNRDAVPTTERPDDCFTIRGSSPLNWGCKLSRNRDYSLRPILENPGTSIGWKRFWIGVAHDQARSYVSVIPSGRFPSVQTMKIRRKTGWSYIASRGVVGADKIFVFCTFNLSTRHISPTRVQLFLKIFFTLEEKKNIHEERQNFILQFFFYDDLEKHDIKFYILHIMSYFTINYFFLR